LRNKIKLWTHVRSQHAAHRNLESHCTSEVTVCLHYEGQSMLYVEVMAVYCERHVKHKLCIQNGRF